MAKEPESLVLRLLRDIRATQNTHGAALEHLKTRVDDLYKISSHTLGVAANAHVRYEALETKLEKTDRTAKRLGANL
jgi:hypothetical protein